MELSSIIYCSFSLLARKLNRVRRPPSMASGGAVVLLLLAWFASTSAFTASSSLRLASGSASGRISRTGLQNMSMQSVGSRRNFLADAKHLADAVLVASPAAAWAKEEVYRSGVTKYDTTKLADEWEGFLPTRQVTRGGQTILINQEFNDKKKNGLAVYEGNLILTSYMEGLGREFWEGSRVLELGCGTALGSITASAMGAASVTASDREDTVLALAEKNMKANIMDAARFRTAKVSWGTDVCAADAAKYKREIGGCWDDSSRAPLVGRGKDGNAAYDAIIGADLTYTSGLIAPLAKTLKDFSGPKTEIILCWCEPTLFTFNTDVMTELNEKGIPELEKDFTVQRITSGAAFDAGLSNKARSFILRLNRKN